jgi:cellulose biosynthesis protein BcsQ
LVLVDTPPGEPVLQDLVFAAADYVVIPTRSDDASLDGLVAVAQRFAQARRANPDLTLLGVVLFGVRKGSTRLREQVREALEDALDGSAPVFEATIRYLESAAVDMRRRGLLPHELEQRHSTEPAKRFARLRAGGGRALRDADLLLSSNATGLSGDYAELTKELLTAITNLEVPRTAVTGGDRA